MKTLNANLLKIAAMAALILLVTPMARAGENEPAADAKKDANKIQKPLTVEQHLNAAIESYLNIQALLVSDKVEGIGKEAKSIGATVDEILKNPGAKKDDKKFAADMKGLKEAAEKLTAEKLTLDKAREAFKALSKAAIAAEEAYLPKDLRKDFRRFTCPMAKADWLQKEKETKNPYFGADMLNCGMEVKDSDKNSDKMMNHDGHQMHMDMHNQ